VQNFPVHWNFGCMELDIIESILPVYF